MFRRILTRLFLVALLGSPGTGACIFPENGHYDRYNYLKARNQPRWPAIRLDYGKTIPSSGVFLWGAGIDPLSF